MNNTTATRTNANVTAIYTMRQLGASLQWIADKIGITKERVRQILVKNYGSTKRTFLSTEQLHRLLGLSRNQIMKLYEEGVIIPTAKWSTGSYHFFLWSPSTVETIAKYYKTYRVCKICHRFIPQGRWAYCSNECYREGQKFRYQSAEAKERRLAYVRRCVERRNMPASGNCLTPTYPPESPLAVAANKNSRVAQQIQY